MNSTARAPEQAMDESVTRIEARPEMLCFSDSTRFYRYEIGQVDLLSSEEVTELAQRIELGKRKKKKQQEYYYPPFSLGESNEPEETREAKNKLIEANLRLVLHIARKYKG